MSIEKSREEIELEVREEIRAAQREYKREWRKKNPDKVKANNERFYLKKAAELKARGNADYGASN